MIKTFTTLLCFFLTCALSAEDGYRLWLRYDKVDKPELLRQYRHTAGTVIFLGSSPTLRVAKDELYSALRTLLDQKIKLSNADGNYLLIGTTGEPAIRSVLSGEGPANLGAEGFIIRTVRKPAKTITVITAETDAGILYGVFDFLRLLQTRQNIERLSVASIPKIKYRILDHWDNLNRTVERGYAGISIWNWHELPEYIDKGYVDYARANASIGINGTVLTNVNANALVLTKEYLAKVKTLAGVFRPYGLKVYLTARFSAPVEIGGLKTADPLQPDVQRWWKQKVDEIYSSIPDFGGFLVKANSEGQPGPQNYGRTHADGANMLAAALAPHKGIVMWRAFVYSNASPEDRFKQAYKEFKPLDGKFDKNVLLQVKNGPVDFQPREPFSPLFGAMHQTPLMMEFQLTQEYLGQGTHLVYEAPLFKECLESDTYAKGKGSTVATIIDGTADNYDITGIAGVANTGNELNWTNHPFAQANWYAFGRISWDHGLTSSQVAREWISQTFNSNPRFIHTVLQIMMMSRETAVNYMTPLGLMHIMGTGHHYGPAPWIDDAGREDWNPVYYHKADSAGLGFDRTVSGSGALSQYAPEISSKWGDVNTCPDAYLLCFHHISWKRQMKSGRSLWEELCYKYNQGVDSVKWMQQQWNNIKDLIDEERFRQVQMFLAIQVREAKWWRNACLLYFQTFSHLPVPAVYEQADHSLDYYKSLKFPNAPGNGN